MATQTTGRATAPEAALAEEIRIAVPEQGLRHDVRAVSIIMQRELIRTSTDRLRSITSLIQPVLFLLVLGTGLASLAGRSMPPGVSFNTFIYPGVLAMSVLFTAIFSAASIVWDREFGFLREMLVAPVRRWAIVVGKCLGGATVATFQGIIFLALAGVAHVPYDPVLLLTLVGELLLLSFTLTVFGHLSISPLALTALSPGVTWDGWLVPLGLSLAMVAAMGFVMLAIAIAEFRKTE